MGTFLVTASHFGQPRYNEALGVYERAVEIYTVADTHNKEANMLKAKNGLAHVMFRTGRVDDAMELMNQVEAECASSTTLVEKDEVRLGVLHRARLFTVWLDRLVPRCPCL
eukprot:m.1475765 g.1475765  ORF g.1475765 m.1475765 type:complete len:111 (-) comp25155_c0_seq33:1193-1525(-)